MIKSRGMGRALPTKQKKGGRVKGKCKVDGIAQRGKTRAKHK